MHGLRLLGLNHTTAPLEVRERVAFSRRGRVEALAALRRQYPSAEAVILSTCNRVELYIAANGDDRPTLDQAAAFLSNFHHVEPDLLNGRLYHHADRAAVEHLFHVAASLDSMVVGERQILGQVREAYDVAQGLGATGGRLNPLFQQAIAAGRQVMGQTLLGRSHQSLASMAVDLARQIFRDFRDKTVLCIGAGKMAALTLAALEEMRPRQLRITNRALAKAAHFAGRFGAVAVPFMQLDDELVDADIVLSSTGSADPILTQRQIMTAMERRRHRPLFLIDIALPRDIEPAVGDLADVHLYNIDDLKQAADRMTNEHREAIAAAETMVHQRIEAFMQWESAHDQGSRIEQLYADSHRMADQELARLLPRLAHLTPVEEDELKETARRLVNRLLHEPVRAMRHGADDKMDRSQLRRALREELILYARRFRPDDEEKPDE